MYNLNHNCQREAQTKSRKVAVLRLRLYLSIDGDLPGDLTHFTIGFFSLVLRQMKAGELMPRFWPGKKRDLREIRVHHKGSEVQHILWTQTHEVESSSREFQGVQEGRSDDVASWDRNRIPNSATQNNAGLVSRLEQTEESRMQLDVEVNEALAVSSKVDRCRLRHLAITSAACSSPSRPSFRMAPGSSLCQLPPQTLTASYFHRFASRQPPRHRRPTEWKLRRQTKHLV
ncbi:hypothetical protein R3P38DRAFT_3136915 [Favolaschia claudopus]|uniref:Uncharacterized protein n=1 Tax=Favolaschia claudopus TaxID=2862362 RepID=A0AAV9Z646_9AGAR